MQIVKKKISLLINNGFDVSTQVKSIALLVSLLIFIGGIILSIQYNPGLIKDVNWVFIFIILLVGVPITVSINAIRYILTGNLIKRKIPIISALNITVFSTVANMLPLPGGVLVRIAGLKTVDISYQKGISATILVFIVWVAMTCLYAASALYLITFEVTIIEITVYVVGIVLLGLSIYLLKKMRAQIWLILLILGTELFAAATDAFRLWLCFLALSEQVDFLNSSVLTISAVVGSAISIVPAGLGLREATTALIAPIVNISASAGFVVTALNRLIGFIGIIPLVILLQFLNFKQSKFEDL